MKIESIANTDKRELCQKPTVGIWFNEVDRELEYVRKLIQEKEKALEKAPPGSFEVAGPAKNRFYYKDKEGRRTYLSNKKQNLIEALAQKDYDEKLLRNARKQLKSLERIRRILKSTNWQDPFGHLSETRKELVVPAHLSDEEVRKIWYSMEYSGKDFEPNSPEYYTSKGERVRSKAEGDIGTALSHRNQLYHYEYPISLPPYGVVYPDFMILNLKTRQIVLWEHLGRMDDMKYVQNNLRKIEAYRRNGYYPGINLILTHETANKPLTFRDIENTIDAYLT